MRPQALGHRPGWRGVANFSPKQLRITPIG